MSWHQNCVFDLTFVSKLWMKMRWLLQYILQVTYNDGVTVHVLAVVLVFMHTADVGGGSGPCNYSI